MQDTSGSDQDLLLMVGRIDANVAELLTKASGHETRIRSLEADRWKVVGAFVALTALLTQPYLHPLVGFLTGGFH